MAAISNIGISANTFRDWFDATNDIIDKLNAFGDANAVTITGGSIQGVNLSASTISDTSATLTNLTLGTPLSIANGGTGANNAVDARTNLGVLTENEISALVQGDAITFAIALG